MITNSRLLVGTFLAVLFGLLTPGLAGAADPYPGVPTPEVTGPVAVTPSSYPFLATDIDLARYGYVEEEYFISGRGYRYDTSGSPRPVDQTATRIETGGPTGDGTYPFKTRIVVRRPADPADANGTVLAEWNNVTAGRDIEWNWFGDPEFMLKNGYTFVGVTAQNVGIAGLKVKFAARYGDLDARWNPSMPIVLLGQNDSTLDDLSYDVYGSAIKAIKGAGTGEDPLGGIEAEKVIASGESQSCGRLAAHHNFIEPLQQIVDAYLITVCGSSLRTDRPEKVVRVITETENRTARPTSTFPDTDSIRHWEVAGSSHLPRLAWDNAGALLNRDFLALTVSCSKFPLSLVQWPFTVNRAIRGLEDWVDGKGAPPIAPRGQYVPNPDYVPGQPSTPSAPNPEFILDRDQYGIAKGGIRYPDLNVPTATNDGVNSPAGGGSPFSLFCGLLGSSTPFGSDTLASLYRDHADFLKKYYKAADDFLKTDFILAEDVPRLKKAAREYPRLRPAAPVVKGKGRAAVLTWVGTEAPATTFTVQRTSTKGKPKWATVSLKIIRNQAFLTGQPKGTWRYRVRSSTIIPENNIAPAETVTTPFSAPGKPVKITR